MLVVLSPVLITILMTFTSAEVNVEFPGTAIAVRQPDLDGKVSSKHLLFQADVSSKLPCASTCMKYDCCAAFSTSPTNPPSQKMTCRGHNSRRIITTSTVEVSESQTYVMEEKPPASSWLERSCSSDADCPANLTYAKCDGDAGKCLCEPGYYYSHCRDNCVPECRPRDLQSTFLKYPGRYLAENTPRATVTNCNTSEKWQAACLQHPHCRTVDVNRAQNNCYLLDVTILVNPSAFTEATTADHFQRTCLADAFVRLPLGSVPISDVTEVFLG